MVHNIHLNIKNKQEDNDKKLDTIDYQGEGLLYKKGKNFYIVYNDSSEGLNNVRTTVKINPVKKRVKLIRPEPFRLYQIFEKNKKYKTIYRTPSGSFNLEFRTTDLEIKLADNNGKIRLRYEIRLGGEFISKNNLLINYKIED